MDNHQNETKTEFRNEANAKVQPYRNEGLIRWEAQRAEWLRPKPDNESKKKSANDKSKQERDVINAEDIAERIFSQNLSSWQLDEPIPLSDMVDLLIDFWQDEGLYD